MCDGNKGGTTDDVFQALKEPCHLWESGASVGADIGLFNRLDLLLAQEREKT